MNTMEPRLTGTTYLSTAEAAEYFGVHVNTILNRIHAGGLTAYRFGRQYRIRLEDLEASLEPTR